MKEFVGDLEGVEKVHPKMIFDPPWSPEMMSEDAKFALGFLTPGLQRRIAVRSSVPSTSFSLRSLLGSPERLGNIWLRRVADNQSRVTFAPSTVI